MSKLVRFLNRENSDTRNRKKWGGSLPLSAMPDICSDNPALFKPYPVEYRIYTAKYAAGSIQTENYYYYFYWKT